MLKKDQEYRSMISQNQLIDSDSLWVLQSKNDSVNKYLLLSIIKDYGYPSGERTGSDLTKVLTLHYTLEGDYTLLRTIFNKELKKGNMPPDEYARWVDRCMINMKKPNVYGVYGKKSFCGEELEQVNRKRKEIGLTPLEKDCP